ncbi:hypothetical protein GCM10010178_61700 [Lentzea flava]|uniref:Uncharacterized protein n=1 Tax=Lentzea flava TaxID=103732 RepID=A0ABQ2UZ29_9PSEU|nr:hypothetical protein GCM10010178_61700 [Lentzea flava]
MVIFAWKATINRCPTTDKASSHGATESTRASTARSFTPKTLPEATSGGIRASSRRERSLEGVFLIMSVDLVVAAVAALGMLGVAFGVFAAAARTKNNV